MVLSSIGRADGSWYPHSRATQHVMNDFLKLIISDKYIGTGNKGRSKGVGRGSPVKWENFSLSPSQTLYHSI